MNKEERVEDIMNIMAEVINKDEMHGDMMKYGIYYVPFTSCAETLCDKGYHKTMWHKVVDRDFPPTNKKVLFKLAEYDELTVGFLREDGLFDLETYPGFYGTDADVIAWTELPTYGE